MRVRRAEAKDWIAGESDKDAGAVVGLFDVEEAGAVVVDAFGVEDEDAGRKRGSDLLAEVETRGRAEQRL